MTASLKTTVWDKVLIGGVIAVSIIGIGLKPVIGSVDDRKIIVIKVENEIVKRIYVGKNSDDKIHSFQFGSNTGYIEIKGGAVRMLEMDKVICPQGICSDTGWISRNKQTIVCLPNKIVVSIEQKQKDAVDAVIY